MPINVVASSVFLFLLAGLCEIGGGWFVWQWLREGKGLPWGFIGAGILILKNAPKQQFLTQFSSEAR